MDLPATFAWLVDEAGASSGPDLLLADGARAGQRRPDARGAAPDHRPPNLAVAGGHRGGDRGAALRRSLVAEAITTT
jgi:hypothetical protein